MLSWRQKPGSRRNRAELVNEQVKICKFLAKSWMIGYRTAIPGKRRRHAWEHPADVVSILMEEWPDREERLQVWDIDVDQMCAVAWAHDIIEDGVNRGKPVSGADLVMNNVSIDVIRDIQHLSMLKRETKVRYLERLRSEGSRLSKIVKCADRIANLREGAPTFKPPRWERYFAETLEFIVPIARDVGDPWFEFKLESALKLRPMK